MSLKVYTIPPTTKFLPDLAAGIFELAGGMGPDLTRFRILLPTRRACRELRDEFLRLSNGKPLLLPRMNPLGDIDQEELDLMIAGTIEAEAIETIPPALSSLERQMMLTSLIQRKNPEMRGEQCLSLARALGRLMDQVYTEDLNLSALPTLVDQDALSKHWSQTVEFLTILSEVWPLILAEEDKIDAGDRRNRLLKLLAKFWQDHPPQTPIIAAGSTGSIPATGNLLHVIAGLPLGHVILPGLDLDMDETSWKHIGETHPQNTMKRLINRMELPRHQVKLWRNASRTLSPRLDIARAATCPADTCDTFKIEADRLKVGLQNVSLIEADNSRHEAQLIALAIRECLETPDHKAVIITPDRNLARRISASLKRWNIQVDDSAGQPLHMKPAGIFFNRMMTCVLEDFAPLALLDFLKTPYMVKRFGKDMIGYLETNALRGPRPQAGLSGLKTHILLQVGNEKLIEFIDQLSEGFAPLLPFVTGHHDLSILIHALVKTAENLTGSTEEIWGSPDGESLALLLSELQNLQTTMNADLLTHQGYLNQFMSERMVRSAFGTHPRVTILGQIEARLIGANLMIMAGLNEGTWPPEPAVDPWMSRPMRKRFGLPPIERQTGLSAHDFVQAFNADEVILTRARKMDGTPTVPARWLERLSALLENAKLDKSILTDQAHWVPWLAQLDKPSDIKTIEKPQPSPALMYRPTKLGVTGVEKLMKNPYQVYASHILNLRPLDPIDQDVSAADRGEFIHHILNQFVSSYPKTLPPDSEAILLRMGEDKLNELREISPSWQYWWPRFQNLVPAFIEYERDWRNTNYIWKTEIQGYHDFIFNGVTFTLTAKADRIDMRDEGAAIIDYKTGTAPSLRNIVTGKAPQLSLEALLLSKGGFDDVPIDVENISLSYWTLTGKRDPLDVSFVEGRKPKGWKEPIVMSSLVEEAEDGFTRLMTAFMSDITPYTPTVPTGRLYDDEKAYKHLARVDEWSVTGEADEEAA